MCCDGSRREFLHLVYDVHIIVVRCRSQPGVCRLSRAEVRARKIDLGVFFIPRSLNLVAPSVGGDRVPGLQIFALSFVCALQSLLSFEGFLEFCLDSGVSSPFQLICSQPVLDVYFLWKLKIFAVPVVDFVLQENLSKSLRVDGIARLPGQVMTIPLGGAHSTSLVRRVFRGYDWAVHNQVMGSGLD